MAGSANDGALVHEKGCDLGRTENPASQEFHNFANVTNAIIWEAVAAVTRAHLAAEWVALVAARPRLRAVGSVPRSTASVGPTRRLDEPEIERDFAWEHEPPVVDRQDGRAGQQATLG